MKSLLSLSFKKLKELFIRPVFLLLAFTLLCSHNLYLKMETYFLEPNQEATLNLYNGTFETSENIITRDRMLDASIVSLGERKAIPTEQWKDQDTTITQLTFNTDKAGTYVAGVSTKARNIELAAEKFNEYLEHDGIFDMLDYRTENDLLNQDAIESYAKHVKAIYQVGDLKTDDWKTVLGYPIEFVPQENPYEKYTGENLAMQLLLDGKPLADQLVYIDYVAGIVTHTHDEDTHEHKGKKHKHKHGKENHDQGDKKHEHKHDDDTHEHDGKKHQHKHGKESHDHDNKNHKHKHGKDKHTHTSGDDHTHDSAQVIRTNEEGLFVVDLPEDGIYYLRTIHMVPVNDGEEITHESKWATLTFEVTHDHNSDSHTHDHDEEEGIPIWIFIVGSLLAIGVLFLVFRKK